MGAVILTADTLATEWFFKDGISLTVNDLLPFLKSEEDVNRSAKAHKAILDWIKTNPGKFDVSQDDFVSAVLFITRNPRLFTPLSRPSLRNSRRN